MTEDNKYEIFMKAIRGEETPRAAVGCVNQTVNYEQMEELGIGWPDANFNADLMVDLAYGAYSILGYDAVRVPFCQTIEQEALGCGVLEGTDKNLPSINKHPYDINMTPVFPEDFLQRGRVPMMSEVVKSLKKKTNNEVAVIGGVIGPFTIVGAMIALDDFLEITMLEPEKLTPFLEVATKAATALAKSLVEAGADVICVEDMLASMDMVSPGIYNNLAWSWERDLIQEIDAPVVLHICGKVDHIIKPMIDTGAAALSFEPKTDIEKVKEIIKAEGRNIGIVGGVPAIEDLFYGNAEQVKESTLKAIDDGYNIIAPGCSVPPAASTEKLKAMLSR